MYFLLSFFIIAISYLLGSFPTGKLVSHLHGIDIEKVGSGNVGATNLARTIGKKAGIITLLGDVFKGFLAVLLSSLFPSGELFFGASMTSWCVVAVVLGHCFSLPGLRGGKGVATALGVILYLSLWVTTFALAVFALVFWKSRYVSAASITACLAAPLLSIFLYSDTDWPVALGIAALIVTYRHKDNLKRLTEGTESKFSFATTVKS